jgi:hypothetical protein
MMLVAVSIISMMMFVAMIMRVTPMNIGSVAAKDDTNK